MSFRALPTSLAVLALCFGCVESSFYTDAYFSASSATIEGTDDPLLRVKTSVDFYAGGDRVVAYYLDSASITVTDRGQTFTLAAPDLDLSKFPLMVDPIVGARLDLDLSGPSPVPGYRGLPDYCGAQLRTATVSLTFYVPESDTDLDQAPPLTTVPSFPTPILPAAALQPVSIFDTTWVRQVAVAAPEFLPARVGHMAAVGTDTVLFAVPTGELGEHSLFSADGDSVESAGLLGGYGQSPALAGAEDGTFFVGGLPLSPSNVQVDYVLIEKRSTASGELWAKSFNTPAGIPDTLQVSAMAATASGGVVVGIESSEAVDFVTEVVGPQPGKYYGAIWLELDADGEVVDARQAPGDVLAIEMLPGGDAIVVYGDLPPVDVEPREIHVVRQDALGTPIWTLDYPMLTYDVTLSVDAAGAAFVVANDSAFGGRVVALDVTDQGVLAAQFTAPGVAGSGARLPDGRRFLAYSGLIEGQSSVDVATFSAPALLELDASLNVTRAQTVACGGFGAMRATRAGGAILALTFEELASLGQEVLDPGLGQMLVGRVD